MEQMALSSGAAITTFVASNAALNAAENAGLDPAQQDWAPVSAFIQGAVSDPNVREVVLVDRNGVVRAASNAILVGRPYVPVRAPALRTIGRVSASEAGESFRFVRPIQYAGRDFGLVDVSLSKAELTAAANLSKMLMAALSLVILLVVAGVSWIGARLLAAPIGRLKTALDEAGELGDVVRITHHRRDEFGQLFESFNRLSAAVHKRIEVAEQAVPAPQPAVRDMATPAAFAAPIQTPIPDKADPVEEDLQRTVIRR
jgi:methyl-accepting chemotaxis protein